MCCSNEFVDYQLFTLREPPPAHSEALPMGADGTWQEETHIVNQSGQGEEGGPLGALLEGLGVLLGLFWGVLGPSWGSLGGSGRSLGAILEAIDHNRVWHLLVSPRRGPKSRLLGPPLGRSWALLGPSWASLGPALRLSWAI